MVSGRWGGRDGGSPSFRRPACYVFIAALKHTWPPLTSAFVYATVPSWPPASPGSCCAKSRP